MLQYVSINRFRHLNSLINLWNGEYRKLFPIKKSLYKQLILEDSNLNKDASFVALYDNEPVGFIFVKTWFTDSGLNNESEKAHISLIFVKKEMRNMGIGSDMLQLAISEVKKYNNIKKVVVGNDMKKIFPGIPSNLTSGPIFFLNKGFVQKEGVVDMISVIKNDETDDIDYKGLEVSIATEEEKEEILKLCVENGWNREAFLLNEYFEKGGTGRRLTIAKLNDKIVGIVRFNDENRLPFKTTSFMKEKKLGNIVFVKVDKQFRQEGYDVVLNLATRNYMKKRKCKKVIISATNKIGFYKKLGYSAYTYYLQYELEI